MTSLWSVDPGARFHALASFANRVLHYVSFVDTYAIPDAPPDVLVIEKMHIYLKELRGGAKKVAIFNSLLEVENAAGRLEMAVIAKGGPRAIRHIPEKWKSQLDKVTHHNRMWFGVLTPEEREVFAQCAGFTVSEVADKLQAAARNLAVRGEVTEYDWAAHNLLDAVGIGLFHLGRMTNKGLPSRLKK